MKPRTPRRPTSSGKVKRHRAPRASVPALQQPVAVAAEASVGDPIVLNTPATWLAFGYLLLVAVLLVFAKWLVWLVLITAGFVVFFRALFWLCQRYPRTMFVITAILRGFFSRR